MDWICRSLKGASGSFLCFRRVARALDWLMRFVKPNFTWFLGISRSDRCCFSVSASIVKYLSLYLCLHTRYTSKGTSIVLDFIIVSKEASNLAKKKSEMRKGSCLRARNSNNYFQCDGVESFRPSSRERMRFQAVHSQENPEETDNPEGCLVFEVL